jgi:hypothetical protein
MALNSYFKNYTFKGQQRLVDDLMVQSIKMWGFEVYYIPRNIENIDHFFGEDPAGSFGRVAKFEIYFKQTDGYGGEGHFMQKFGVEARDSITLYVAQRRWQQIRTDKLTTENGYTYMTESADLTQAQGTEGFVMDTDEATPFDISSPDYYRPKVGDLIYFPNEQKFFSITFVDDNEIFMPMGRNPVFTMECDLFDYSDETITTGVSEIDNLAAGFDSTMSNSTSLKEDGFKLQTEEGVSIIGEDYNVGSADPGANNSLIDSLVKDIVDWTDVSPLVGSDGNGRW